MNIAQQTSTRARLARLGLLGFAFFFLKGIAWLVAGWAVLQNL